MQAASEGYVLLRGGLALPVVPVLLAFDLEARGVSLSRDGDDLVVWPLSSLTDEDKLALRSWKYHIFALLAYTVEAVQ